MLDNFSLELSNGTQYPYQIVTSNRAKYIRIKLSRQGNLRVTLPSYTKIKHAHDFVSSKRLWIEKNLVNITEEPIQSLPEKLDLLLLDEVWTIDYKQISSHSLSLKESKDFSLSLNGDTKQINDSILVVKLLNQWCRRKAKNIFNQMLQEQAEIHGFHYQRLSIRSQKTRWGSCSHQKNINLNCKLLFMPEEVVKYVMIHELCHTIEMNHSSRFWALVEECDPVYKSHRKQLKSLGKAIIL